MKANPKFLNDLYRVQTVQADTENHITTYQLQLNPAHPLFQGHFPGSPVLPGACTVQIIKELISEQYKKDLLLIKAGTLKFLSFINPEINAVLLVNIQARETDEGIVHCQATVYFKETVFCTFKGEWNEQFAVRGSFAP